MDFDFEGLKKTNSLKSVKDELFSLANKRSYPSRPEKRRLMEERYERIRKAMISADMADRLEMAGIEGYALKRRITAAVAFMEELPRHLDSRVINDLISVEEVISDFEGGVPKGSYAGLEYEHHILPAIALWILDDLKKNKKLHEAFQYLPKSFDDVMEGELPTNFYDPCFESELVQSVIFVISNRNKKDNERPRHSNVFIDERDSWKTDTDSGRSGDKLTSTHRQNFDGLISLVDETAARRAGEVFREKIWEVITRYAEAISVLDRQNTEAVRQANQQPSVLMVKPSKDNEDELFRKAAMTVGENLDLKSRIDIEFELFLDMNVKQAAGELGNRKIAKKIAGFTIDDPYEICFGLFYLLEQNDDCPWMLKSGYCVIENAAKLLPWYMSPFEHFDEEDDESYTEWDSDRDTSFDEENWDDDDDSDMDDDALDIDDWHDSWDHALVYDQNGWIERQDREGTKDEFDLYHDKYDEEKNIAQIVYGLTGAVLPRNLHPFESERQRLLDSGMAENIVRKTIDTSELLFLTQFKSTAANLRENEWWNELGFEEDADDVETYPEQEESLSVDDTFGSSGDPQPAKTIKATGYWGKVAEKQGSEVSKAIKDIRPDISQKPSTESIEQDYTLTIEESLRKLKDENKSLKKALSELSRQSAQDKAKRDKEIESLLREHRELADLRELVFNRGNSAIRSAKANPAIKFPYETQKQTVIFGGHETFVKKLKPKFNNIKFVDPDQYAFSPELVRNSEVIWIQNNCIAHAQYYKIVNIARQYGIQVRYFPYDNVDKCAEMIVEFDIKNA